MSTTKVTPSTPTWPLCLNRFYQRRSLLPSSSALSSISSTMAARRILQVNARAFVSPATGGGEAVRGGGNPVTIFSSSPSTKITSEFRSRLAQTCAWESVVVEPSQEDSTVPQFSFFMPSGEEVSFCARKLTGALCVDTSLCCDKTTC